MSDQRERLAKIIGTYDGEAAQRNALEAADRLLAAGVTLPPEPPRLVTEEMLAAPWDALNRRLDSAMRWHYIEPHRKAIELAHANALVESAIRRAVERKTSEELYEFYRQLGTVNSADSARIVLALFGLEAS